MKAFIRILFLRISRIGRKRDLTTQLLEHYRATTLVNETPRELFKSRRRETFHDFFAIVSREAKIEHELKQRPRGAMYKFDFSTNAVSSPKPAPAEKLASNVIPFKLRAKKP